MKNRPGRRQIIAAYIALLMLALPFALLSQTKDKTWLMIDSVSYADLSENDRYLLDSILPVYHKAQTTHDKLEQLSALAENISDENVWPKYNRLMLKLVDANSSRKEFLKYKAIGLNNTGFEAMEKGSIPAAIRCFKSSMEISAQINDRENMAVSMSNIGSIYENQANIRGAIDYYSKALKIDEQIGNKQGEAILLNNLGSLYKNQGDTAKAIELYFQSIAMREKIGDRSGVSNTLNNLAFIYNHTGNIPKAIEYYTRSLKLRKEIGNRQNIAQSLGNLGSIYMALGDLDKTKLYYDSALVLRQQVGDKKGIANSYLNFGNLYLKLKDIPKAESYGIRAMQASQELGFPDYIQSCADLLYKVYKLRHHADKALDMYELSVRMKDSIQNSENKNASIRQQFKYDYEKKTATDSIRQTEQFKLEQIKHDDEIHRQKLYSYGGILGFVFMLLIAGISLRAYSQKKQAGNIISEQKQIVEEKQKEIIDSITYAKRIQYALLANNELLKENLGEHFVLFKPKDIVSGDFYWATKNQNGFYLAVCDSTGHGVPGAFMSVLNTSFLREAINEKNIAAPHQVLDSVRRYLMDDISQEGGQDGMDAILLRLKHLPALTTVRITYAAANNAPVLIRDQQVIQLPKDKMPVGKGEKMESFNVYTIDVKKGDQLYLYTDGYADQFGGPAGKKFKYRQLEELLVAVSNKPFQEQSVILNDKLESWKGSLDQVDDVLVIGFKI